MNINQNYINEYRRIIQSTNLQKGYQELMKFFRCLRIFLEKEMKDYKFTGNIVENNMDYSYFQLTDEELKPLGLKIVVAFIHRDFSYEVWLSGDNRKVQREYYDRLKRQDQKYTLTADPNKTDYIIRTIIIGNVDYGAVDQTLDEMKLRMIEFADAVKLLLK